MSREASWSDLCEDVRARIEIAERALELLHESRLVFRRMRPPGGIGYADAEACLSSAEESVEQVRGHLCAAALDAMRRIKL